MITILQGSVVTQTTLGGLTIHPPVANFLQCRCAKNYESCWALKVIAITKRVSFVGPRCSINEKVLQTDDQYKLSCGPLKSECRAYLNESSVSPVTVVRMLLIQWLPYFETQKALLVLAET